MIRALVCALLAGQLSCQTDATIGSNFIGLPAADAMPLPQCADADDNDGDSAIDYPFDPGCQQPGDDSELDPPVPPACSDGADNDGDTAIDFPDEPGCESAADDDETDPSPLPECSDGIDNDGDSAIDYPADDGCQGAGSPTESTVTS